MKNPLTFTLVLIGLSFALPSWAKNIPIRFPSGSYCGSYEGAVRVGDNFVLSLAKEQQLVIKNHNGHPYSVIAPNGTPLKVVQSFSEHERQYWTGNRAGNFRVRIDGVPSGLQADLEFCAYSGEGAS